MPPPTEDAPIGAEFVPSDQIPPLAALYDAFAHSLDPFSPERDNAEKVFLHDVASWHDMISPPKPSLQDFRKAVILRCKRHLCATNKSTTV